MADAPGSGSDTLALPTQQVLGLIADLDIQSAVGDASRVWLVIFSHAIQEYQTEGYKNHPHILWLEKNYILDRIEPWGDLKLYVYVRE